VEKNFMKQSIRKMAWERPNKNDQFNKGKDIIFEQMFF